MGRFNEEKFIKEFNEIHNNEYEYLSYENGLVKFLCKKHNEINYDTPSHLRDPKRGCKICGKERQSLFNKNSNKLAKETFIEKAKKIHGDKYDYSKTVYVKNSIKVIVTCPTHGDFTITPNSHLNGEGCYRCGLEHSHEKFRKTKEQFIEEAKKIHGDKYDYSKVEYVNTNQKVCIICPEHGEFWQVPFKHLMGQGCRKCGIKKRSAQQMLTTEQFIEKARQVHGDKYDYSKVVYNGYDNEVIITCPKHGDFKQIPDSHIHGSGCQKCSSSISKYESEIYEFICNLIGKDNVIQRERNILKNKAELDIFIPSKNIAIEYNGCRWHSEQFNKDKNYHLSKTLQCRENGIKLIQIFEDEYIDKKEIVLSKLKHLLNIDDGEKIQARKCLIYEISYYEAKKFLEKNHIQGKCKSTIYLGAYYEKNIVGVMALTKLNDDNEWELNRFATKINTISQGIGSKMFSFFIEKYKPETVKSFADRRWTINENENLYTKLGFRLKSILQPDYKYIIDGTYNRVHKFNFRKSILSKKYNLPMSLTEREMCEKIKAYKIWDCGLLKYIWKKSKIKIIDKEIII